MMAILTGSASAVPVAKHPAPASASAAQNFLIAPSPLIGPRRGVPRFAREDSVRPCPPEPAIARARAASCSGGGASSRRGSRSRPGRDLRRRPARIGRYGLRVHPMDVAVARVAPHPAETRVLGIDGGDLVSGDRALRGLHVDPV